MTYALAAGPTEEAVQEAASLLDQQIEVRPALSPVVVAKYPELARHTAPAPALPPDTQGPPGGQPATPRST